MPLRVLISHVLVKGRRQIQLFQPPQSIVHRRRQITFLWVSHYTKSKRLPVETNPLLAIRKCQAAILPDRALFPWAEPRARKPLTNLNDQTPVDAAVLSDLCRV